MADDFDPYQQWLGIAKHEHPPSHYRLLGVGELMDDVEAIGNAADRQMNFVRTFQLGKHRELSQKILRELAEAKICLLNPASKAAYDSKLRQSALPVATAATPAPPQSVPPLPTSHVAALPWIVEASASQGTAQPLTGEVVPPTEMRRSYSAGANRSRGFPQWVWIGLAVAMTLAVGVWVVIRISDSRTAAAKKTLQKEKTQVEADLPRTPSVAQNVDGSLNLLAALAEAEGSHARSITQNGETFITGLETVGDGAFWPFIVEKGKRGVFRAVVEYASAAGAEGGEFTVSVNGKPIKAAHKVRATGGEANFLRVEIGFVKVQELDGNVLRIGVKSPNMRRTTIMNVRSVRLYLEQRGKG